MEMKKLGFVLATLVVAAMALGAAVALSAQKKAADDKAEIQALEKRFIAAFNARNIAAIMDCYAREGLFVFDVIPPRQYVGWEAYKKDWEQFLAQYPGPVKIEISDLSVTAEGNIGFGHSIQSGFVTRKNGTKLTAAYRVTDGYRKINGKWLIVHEHVSVPVDLETGKAELLSKP